MSVQLIRPARTLQGSLTLPGDKSISHRYAMLAGLAEGTTRLTNFSTGADPHSTLACMAPLGADCRQAGRRHHRPSPAPPATSTSPSTTSTAETPAPPCACSPASSPPHPHTFTLIGDPLPLRRAPWSASASPSPRWAPRSISPGRRRLGGHAPITIVRPSPPAPSTSRRPSPPRR